MKEVLRYLTFDQQFIKKMNSSTSLKSKEELYSILNWWNKLSKSDTIGDLDQMNCNTPLIIIKLGSSSYYINADTNRAGVEAFLKNKINPWRLINNRDTKKNKITNDYNNNPIEGLYMYKKLN
ncbi:hypothetical protein OAS02_06750 [Flavobacteriaceae bacterium]|nr:hypothetical protein [Flavobacteriaceae bacterium]